MTLRRKSSQAFTFDEQMESIQRRNSSLAPQGRMSVDRRRSTMGTFGDLTRRMSIAANVHKISRNHNTCTFETNQHKIQEIIEKIEEAKRRNPMKLRWNEFEKLIKKLESFRDVSY